MISGKTRLIAHIGYPTEAFKAPLIYNPWFESRGIDAVVVPMGVKSQDYPAALAAIRRFTNFHGALVTMPHKVTTVALLDVASKAVQIAGSCNALRLQPDGRLRGDMFDGAGFVRGVLRKGLRLKGASCLVVGAGGVGSAIAASLAAEGPARMMVFDSRAESAAGLAARLRQHYPEIDVLSGSKDPAGFDLVVNATPLGMNPGDALPFDVTRLSKDCFVGEVVMRQEITPLLQAALDRGCRIQVGTEMLFEMIPAYLEFFGLGTATPDELRAVARVSY
ncbi:MAG: Shikimate 5-dehydrogenase alpha [Burkholderiaceae bacterium]|nr:Shikimate 5-dehydrogenase alpha [Burkholderiaceae bacterium]